MVVEPGSERRFLDPLPVGLLWGDPRRPGSPAGSARRALDRSMDAVRVRFGRDEVGYLPAALARATGVPDDFRELAEREP